MLFAVLCAAVIASVGSVQSGSAQSVPYQREFTQSKAVVDGHLRRLQASSAGPLPALAGFVVPGDRALDLFHRGYYQCTAQVSSIPSGGSIVKVNAVITAWYTDPVSAKSGYQVLPSNGRLEADFLNRLQDLLGHPAPGALQSAHPPAPVPGNPAGPEIPSAPLPNRGLSTLPPKGTPFKSADPMSLDHMPSLATEKAVVDRHAAEQEKEAQGLEEILRNQVRPTNLVAVKQKDTPVLANPDRDAKVLFLAAAEDEFEILDLNLSWVHVRISGPSRGWIRRSDLEVLAANRETQRPDMEAATPPAPANTQPFQVENEQVASFPGKWEPLQGKTVRIVSVEKASDAAATGSGAKLAFAKSLLDKQYAGLAADPGDILGVVVIFDSQDGGMMAATVPAMREWKAGTLSDKAFWRRCFFDPPDAFGLAAKP